MFNSLARTFCYYVVVHRPYRACARGAEEMGPCPTCLRNQVGGGAAYATFLHAHAVFRLCVCACVCV